MRRVLSWAVFLSALVVACAKTRSAPAESSQPAQPDKTRSSPVFVSGIASVSPAGLRMNGADAGPRPSLALPTCIPNAYSDAAIHAQPCETELFVSGVPFARTRYDDQGRLLQQSEFTADGGEVVDDSREYGPFGITHRIYGSGAPGNFNEETWTYAGDGGVIGHHFEASNGFTSDDRYHYPPNGPLASVDTVLADGGVSVHYDYGYSDGRLVSIRGRSPDNCIQADWGWRYAEDGGLRADLIHQNNCHWTSGYGSEHAYDELGRRYWMHTSGDGYDEVTTDDYDGGMAPIAEHEVGLHTNERSFIRDALENPVLEFTLSRDTTAGPFTPSTIRSTFACGTDALMFEEHDDDNDRVVDGTRTFVRDDAGTLLMMREKGLTYDRGNVDDRVEYRYACQSAPPSP